MLPGIQLRTAREKRGLTVLDAAHETRIPPQRLLWLEQDNFAAFGSLTYARSFLKIYSQYLGVDVSELLAELPTSRLGGASDYRYLTENHGPWVMKDRRLDRLLNAVRRKNTSRSPVSAGLAMFVIVLIGTGFWGYHVSQEASQVTQGSPPSPLHEAAPDAQPDALSMQVQPVPVIRAEELGARQVTHPRPAFDAGLPARLQ
ncbi:MAG: helix-turn-helix domain-containing protein [Verrucomicrobiota bacterium]